MNEKFKKSLKYFGITSVIGLISFLSTIFQTTESFSQWKEDHYYPENSAQDLKINTLSTNYLHIKKDLAKLDSIREDLAEIKALLGSRR